MDTDQGELAVSRILDQFDGGRTSELEAHLRTRCEVGTRDIRDRFAWNSADRTSGRVFTEAVAAVPDSLDRALLSLWVRSCCHEAWQHTYRSEQLTEALQVFLDAAERHWEPGDADRRLRLMLEFNRLLAAEIEVEDCVRTGSFDKNEAAVQSVLLQCGEILRIARSLAAGDPIAAYVLERTELRKRYNDGLLTSTRGVRAAMRGESKALERSFKALTGMESEMPKESKSAFVELSEIRAHRQALYRLRNALKDKANWLRVDRGRLVYLFPFSFTDVGFEEISERLEPKNGDPAELHGRVGEAKEDWTIRAGAVNRRFSSLEDIWNPHVEAEQQFDGIELSLPPVQLRVDDTSPLETLACSVRFSPLGLHYLRLERRIPPRGLNPHELHSAFTRGAREHGTIEVTCGDTGFKWPRMSRFARSLLQKGLPSLWDGESLPENVKVHRGRSHVLLTVLHASGYRPEPGGGSEPIHDGERLLELFGGAVLKHAVVGYKESVGDWARRSGAQCETISDIRNDNDLLVSTENTTVVAMLDSPNFVSGALETVAEFTAAFGGALEAWNHRLNAYRRSVADTIKDYEALRSERDFLSDSESMNQLLKRMQHERSSLVAFESHTRQVLSLLYAPNWLRSPSDTVVLARLLELTGIDGQVRAFRERLGEVAADQFEETLQRWEADRQREKDRLNAKRRESTTIALTALGVCAAFQIWQAAGFWPEEVWSWATLLTIVVSGFYMVRPWVLDYGRGSVLRFFFGRQFAVRRRDGNSKVPRQRQAPER